jgi:hypothetical protein
MIPDCRLAPGQLFHAERIEDAAAFTTVADPVSREAFTAAVLADPDLF